MRVDFVGLDKYRDMLYYNKNALFHETWPGQWSKTSLREPRKPRLRCKPLSRSYGLPARCAPPPPDRVLWLVWPPFVPSAQLRRLMPAFRPFPWPLPPPLTTLDGGVRASPLLNGNQLLPHTPLSGDIFVPAQLPPQLSRDKLIQTFW